MARAYDYVQALGKLPIVVNDSRGFYTSRTFGTFVMEGAAMLGEGIPAPVIENAAMQAGMPVGPLAVLDETALSLSVHVLEQTRVDYAERRQTVRGHAGRDTGGADGEATRAQRPCRRWRLLRLPRRPEEALVARAQDPVREGRR